MAKKKPTEEIREGLLDILETEARKFIVDTVKSITYEHETFNLYDSYGYGIYLDGVLKRSSALSNWNRKVASEPRTIWGNEYWGHDVAKSIFSKDISVFGEGFSTKGYSIVFAALMPYAGVLESRNYKVISQMNLAAYEIGSKVFGQRIVENVKDSFIKGIWDK